MPLSDQDVNHVARLARLALTDEDRAKYRRQLGQILDHIASLSKLDTKDVPPTSHVIPVANVWREDEPRPFPHIEAVLAAAPSLEDVFFKVKKVIE